MFLSLFALFSAKKVVYCRLVVFYWGKIPETAVDCGVVDTLTLKVGNSSLLRRFQGGVYSYARYALHLPILGELDTVYRKPRTARGVFEKVVNHFLKFTTGPRGF